MLWSNFILDLNFILFSFKLIVILKTKRKKDLDHNMYALIFL